MKMANKNKWIIFSHLEKILKKWKSTGDRSHFELAVVHEDQFYFALCDYLDVWPECSVQDKILDEAKKFQISNSYFELDSKRFLGILENINWEAFFENKSEHSLYEKLLSEMKYRKEGIEDGVCSTINLDKLKRILFRVDMDYIPEFTIWTHNYVYFPVVEEIDDEISGMLSLRIASVSRMPCFSEPFKP